MKKIFYSILLSGMMVLSACDAWTCLLKIIMALMIFGIRSLR